MHPNHYKRVRSCLFGNEYGCRGVYQCQYPVNKKERRNYPEHYYHRAQVNVSRYASLGFYDPPFDPHRISNLDEELLNLVLPISAKIHNVQLSKLTLTAMICALSSRASLVVTLAAMTGLETPQARPRAVLDGTKT